MQEIEHLTYSQVEYNISQYGFSSRSEILTLCEYAGTHSHGGQKSTSGVVTQDSFTLFPETASPTGLKLFRMVGQ